MDLNTLKNLCVDRVTNKQLNYSADELESTIRGAMLDVLGKTEFKTRREFKRAFENHPEIYEIVENSVDAYIADGSAAKDAFFNQFVDFRSQAVGDVNEFYVEQDSELLVSKVSQGNFNVLKQRIDVGQTFSTKINYYSIGIEEEFYRFISGRCDYAKLVAKMAKAMYDHITKLAQETLVSALAMLPATTNVYSGTYDEEKVSQVVASVEAENKGQAYIVGTKAGLRKLQAQTVASESTMSEVMKNQVNANGYLTTWNGVTCIELPQGFKTGSLVKKVGGTDVPNFIFDDSQLYVICGDAKPVKVFVEEVELRKDYDQTDTMDATLGQVLVAGIGTAVVYDKLFGSIKLI